MIITLAEQRNIPIKECQIGRSVLPTSTRFNMDSIPYPRERTLAKIDEFDEMLHRGPLVHSFLKGDDNPLYFVKALEILSNQVMDQISRCLLEYDRVILTGDHGASRLAVLAHRQNISAQIMLPDTVEIEDWRYIRIPDGMTPPEGVYPDEANQYWVAKGYRHFHKAGKPYETHGGCTLEEHIVPVIVFDREETAFAPPVPVNPTNEITENDNFDL